MKPRGQGYQPAGSVHTGAPQRLNNRNNTGMKNIDNNSFIQGQFKEKSFPLFEGYAGACGRGNPNDNDLTTRQTTELHRFATLNHNK